MRWSGIVASVIVALAGSAGHVAGRQLTHRVWLLGGIPDASVVAELQAANVRGLCLSVGKVTLGDGVSHFEADMPATLQSLAGATLSAVIWVEGDVRRKGDPGRFAVQFAAVEGKLGNGGSLILVSRSYGEGLADFATDVARRVRRPVELAMPLSELVAHAPRGGWKGVLAVAIGLGKPELLSLPSSTAQDDRQGLDALDARGFEYRVAVVVGGKATPPPGAGGGSIAMLTRRGVSAFEPGARGNVFVLQRSLDWGGVLVQAGQRIEVDAMDAAQYDRDLGLLMRPVRAGLRGWDTVGLPAPEPTLGLSREALLDYLRGGGPTPRPAIERSWAANTLAFALVNATPYGSAVSSTGNYLEVMVPAGQVADVQIGEFNGIEFGRYERGALRATVLREAAVIRFYLTHVAPASRVGGASISFTGRPAATSARWSVRLGDGRDVSGDLAIALTP